MTPNKAILTADEITHYNTILPLGWKSDDKFIPLSSILEAKAKIKKGCDNYQYCSSKRLCPSCQAKLDLINELIGDNK